jgi:hypothetical protein
VQMGPRAKASEFIENLTAVKLNGPLIGLEFLEHISPHLTEYLQNRYPDSRCCVLAADIHCWANNLDIEAPNKTFNIEDLTWISIVF